MSIEDSRRSPQIAEKLRALQQQNQQEEAVLPKKPIEEVAMAYLQELDEIKRTAKNLVSPDTKVNPLVLAYGNGRFIDQRLATPNLKELLIRTDSDILFDNNGFLIYGGNGLSENNDIESEDNESDELGVSLWFNDGRRNLNPLLNITSFQESWDRSSKEGRKVLANFGRLSKQQIIKKFEALARENVKFNY